MSNVQLILGYFRVEKQTETLLIVGISTSRRLN